MKKTFVRETGELPEKLDLSVEDKWIFVYYSIGETEKSAYIIKNGDKTYIEYLAEFLKECNVSEEIQTEINKALLKTNDTEENWMKFTTFLIKAITYNIVIGIILALSIFGGYKLGAKADTHYALYPLFTVIGVFSGIGFGGYCGFVLIKHYFAHKDESTQKLSPLFSDKNKQ